MPIIIDGPNNVIEINGRRITFEILDALAVETPPDTWLRFELDPTGKLMVKTWQPTKGVIAN